MDCFHNFGMYVKLYALYYKYRVHFNLWYISVTYEDDHLPLNLNEGNENIILENIVSISKTRKMDVLLKLQNNKYKTLDLRKYSI